MPRYKKDRGSPRLQRLGPLIRWELPVNVAQKSVTVSGGVFPSPCPPHSPSGISRNREGHVLRPRECHLAGVRGRRFRLCPIAETDHNCSFEQDSERGSTRTRGSLQAPEASKGGGAILGGFEKGRCTGSSRRKRQIRKRRPFRKSSYQQLLYRIAIHVIFTKLH